MWTQDDVVQDEDWLADDDAPSSSLLMMARAGQVLRLATGMIVRRRPPVHDPQARLTEAASTLSAVSKNLIEGHGVEVIVRGTIPEGPVILAANHVGYLDPIVVAALKPCVIIAKSEVASWPVLGWGARTVGVLWVSRARMGGGAQSLRGARDALDHGVSVLNFCEGTTTDGTEVKPFRKGIFQLAQKGGYPVVPVAIQFHDRGMTWTGDATFAPHYARFAARPTTAVNLTFGPAIPAQAAPDAATLAAAARASVSSALGIDEPNQ